ADGINALFGDAKIFKKLKTQIVITPHTGEFSRLTGREIQYIDKNRIDETENFLNNYDNMVLVLKGANTLISNKNIIYMNLTGNSGMATAGSGDVLTGMIGSFIGQGLKPFDAAKLGVFIHGLAGDIASGKKSEMSIIATDILNSIPQAILKLLNYNSSSKNYSLGNLVSIPDFFRKI
ncbi:MAG: NAD(P)H-hydrate dehydratase, partial [Candidatus Firestonebacteria bacterium]|nr:NAD(P)H-hydrate dehydratase [Candidatus Firestonebacteria bacterium]